MKERPILFSAPMVRAILGGCKTQTRRIAPITDLNIKPHSDDMVTWGVSFSKPVKGVFGSYSGGKLSIDQAQRIIASQFNPYGRPGDQLWVREAWRIMGNGPDDTLDMFGRDDIQYRADDDQSYIEKYRPSINMPRRFSRILLEVTGVRVERLNDISEADAIAEGAKPYLLPAHPAREGLRHVDGYAQLWESINGPGAWDANPWVWVIEFKVLEGGAA